MKYIIRIETSMGYKYYYKRPVKYTKEFNDYTTAKSSDATIFTSLKSVKDELITQSIFKKIASLEVIKIETKEIHTPITLLEVLIGD